MYCTYTLTIACLKMFLRNRQAMFFSLFMPAIILFIFGSINFDKPAKIYIGLVTHSPSLRTAVMLEQIRTNDAMEVDKGTLAEELAALNIGRRTMVLDVPDDLLSRASGAGPAALTVYVNAGRPVESQMALSMLHQVADKISLVAASAPSLFTIEQKSVNARNFRYIEFLLPGVMAMAIMQMSVFSVAFVFARYKEQGILKRLLATPMRPSQFVTANIITRLLMGVAQAGIFVALGVYCYHVHIAGALWLLALCVVLGSLMFLGLGFTISGLSKNTESVPVLSNILVFPMLFTGNVFFPISTMPPWLRTVAGYLPLTYMSDSFRGVMTDGAGVLDIKGDLIGMAVWAALLVTFATITFRFQKKEGA